MIETIDEAVRAWLQAAGGALASISFDLPPAASARLTAYAYLFDVDRPAAASSGRLPPVQLRLGYLVTCAGPDAVAAHALLGTLIASAAANPQFVLEFGPSVASAWASLQAPVRPGVVVRATASQAQTGTIAPPVRAVRVDTVTLEPLGGRVTTPDGTPIAGAVVEAPAIGRSTTTDANGAFVLAGATSEIDVALRVRAKGAQTDVTHPAHAAGDIAIALDLTK